MVVENTLSFAERFLSGLYLWCGAIMVVTVVFGTFQLIRAARRDGLIEGGERVFWGMVGAAGGVVSMSPRRVFAMTRLAWKEALRRRVWVVLVVFLIILAFAAWYLDPRTADAAKLYIEFVMTSASFLVVLLALFLSAFSLPADIRSRTLHTVVTKPVRASEIVLGRIIGFAAVGTVLLAFMAVVSYAFVVRALAHKHEVDTVTMEDLKFPDEKEGKKIVRRGRTTSGQFHKHDVEIYEDGTGATDLASGHWHSITSETDADGNIHYTVGPPQGRLTARVPVRASNLSFRSRTGGSIPRGIGVGYTWAYRSYVEGGTLAEAIWQFEGMNRRRFPEESFPNGLPFELTVSVFRTHKGDVKSTVLGAFFIENPQTGLKSEPIHFPAKEFKANEFYIPYKYRAEDGSSLDLFDDLADGNGRFNVIVQCMETGQFFGMAKADLYVRARDASFEMNLVKGFSGIWFQMLLVVGFGVMFSTFLNGAVAMMATASAFIGGFFTKFVHDVAIDKVPGGGPLEAFIRMVRQENIIVSWDPSLGATIIKSIDSYLFEPMMASISVALPDFRSFSDATFVSHGFSIPNSYVVLHLFAAAAYLVPVFVLGYLFLKNREVAR